MNYGSTNLKTTKHRRPSRHSRKADHGMQTRWPCCHCPMRLRVSEEMPWTASFVSLRKWGNSFLWPRKPTNTFGQERVNKAARSSGRQGCFLKPKGNPRQPPSEVGLSRNAWGMRPRVANSGPPGSDARIANLMISGCGLVCIRLLVSMFVKMFIKI